MALLSHEQRSTDHSENRDVERIYQEWDRALSENDSSGLLALYAPDATIESPLIPHVLGWERGICQGREQIRQLFEVVAGRKPEVRRHYHTKYFTDGRTLMWEYPRESPDGEQMDFAEIMELKDGLIHRHRVYWGWFGVGVMNRDAYHRSPTGGPHRTGGSR
jgi:ketosteroid isomerase-like protein